MMTTSNPMMSWKVARTRRRESLLYGSSVRMRQKYTNMSPRYKRGFGN
jgi:hypothetical protein